MFNNHAHCSTEWLFNTRSSVKSINSTTRKLVFFCKENNNHIYNLLKNTIKKNRRSYEIIPTHVWHTKEQKNEQHNHICGTKNNIMAHIISLNSRISYVVRVSIFVFYRYWPEVSDLVDLNIRPTFKQSLQAKTINPEKNNLSTNSTMLKNKSLPQSVNHQPKYSQKYTCKVNCYGLHYWNNIWEWSR